MRRFLFIGLLFSGLPMAALAAETSRTFCIQVICGTDSDKVMPANRHAVGSLVDQRLSPVFRWKHYWEVKRQNVELQQGKTTRVRLTDNRAIEVELVGPNTSEIRLYRDGRTVRKSRQPAAEKLSLMGWHDQGDVSWFVVVRPEKPQ